MKKTIKKITLHKRKKSSISKKQVIKRKLNPVDEETHIAKDNKYTYCDKPLKNLKFLRFGEKGSIIKWCKTCLKNMRKEFEEFL